MLLDFLVCFSFCLSSEYCMYGVATLIVWRKQKNLLDPVTLKGQRLRSEVKFKVNFFKCSKWSEKSYEDPLMFGQNSGKKNVIFYTFWHCVTFLGHQSSISLSKKLVDNLIPHNMTYLNLIKLSHKFAKIAFFVEKKLRIGGYVVNGNHVP